MLVPYKKMHGTGNLILIVDQRTGNHEPPNAQRLKQLGDNATGPGFDQLMWINAASNADSIASYRVFNADGSQVEQCGNGVRCVARYLAEVEHLANAPGCSELQELQLQSPAGPIAARVYSDGQVAVSMGTPSFLPSDIPFLSAGIKHSEQSERYALTIDHATVEIAVVSMGNPHVVIRVANVSEAPVATLGPTIENHPLFPERTNVGFMYIRDPGNIDLRVHERGAGETAACGTGACAAVVSAQRLGELEQDVTVHLPGGQVVVSWRGNAAPVWLKGNAEPISDGHLNL